MRLVNRLVEAKPLGDFFIGWISKDRITFTAAAYEHRDIGNGDMKTIEHRLNAAVLIEIDVRVWVIVSH